jgi:hypothetical protein
MFSKSWQCIARDANCVIEVAVAKSVFSTQGKMEKTEDCKGPSPPSMLRTRKFNHGERVETTSHQEEVRADRGNLAFAMNPTLFQAARSMLVKQPRS